VLNIHKSSDKGGKQSDRSGSGTADESTNGTNSRQKQEAQHNLTAEVFVPVVVQESDERTEEQ
jgi:hypothetical protein